MDGIFAPGQTRGYGDYIQNDQDRRQSILGLILSLLLEGSKLDWHACLDSIGEVHCHHSMLEYNALVAMIGL
jgi:hypothetical protein